MKSLVKIYGFALLVVIACLGNSCQEKKIKGTDDVLSTKDKTVSDGFKEKLSDKKAIEIADNVMEAMGGQESWDNTHYLAWNFFGKRKLVWDKWTGDVRIEIPNENKIILVNINTLQGKVMQNGNEINQPDSLRKYLQEGKEIWINDSYWLVMPFKLKDPGVVLKYAGTDSLENNVFADVLELTFENVGVTPENKYKVYVDKKTNLVAQWAFYRTTDQEKPDFILPWQDYKKYDGILLSGGRGERDLTDIMVFSSLPSKVFDSFESIDLRK